MDDLYELSRRERKKRSCKYTILRAARELIMERGLDVLVEDVANKADISYPTFYNYFPTKASLFYAIYLEEIEDIQEFAEMELAGETSAKRRIERLFNEIMRDFSRYRYVDLYLAGEVAKRTEEDGGEERINRMFRNAIQSGVDAGEFKPGVDANLYGRLITGILLSASFYSCTEADCAGMLSILLAGMCR